MPGRQAEFLRNCATLKIQEAFSRIGLTPQVLVFVAGENWAWSSLDCMHKAATLRQSESVLPARLAG
jgi:hypothetical protein